jgi:MYXO-CTERM domain-containing protein
MTHCATECSAPHGALFCNGQYIDVTAVSQCTFTISASGTVSASGGVSCAVSPGTRSSHEGPVGLALVAGLGFLVARRRRGV